VRVERGDFRNGRCTKKSRRNYAKRKPNRAIIDRFRRGLDMMAGGRMNNELVRERKICIPARESEVGYHHASTFDFCVTSDRDVAYKKAIRGRAKREGVKEKGII
jgi:hypothetical protein